MTIRRPRRNSCHSPLKVTATLLLSFLALSPAAAQLPGYPLDVGLQQPFAPPGALTPGAQQKIEFKLRHVLHHGTVRHPRLLRKLDISPDEPVWMEEEGYARVQVDSFPVSSNPIEILRLSERSPARMDALMAVGRERGRPVDLPASDWTIDAVNGPNVTDQETVLSMAKMASNAYVLDPKSREWEEIGSGFNYTEDFGWETDGLRGHIFADTENKTVVMGLKGTSPAVFDGADTTTNDKINDNLFFSCCCAQGGSVLWHQVCDCQTATYTCNSTCLVRSLKQKDHYYAAAQQLYSNVTALYPDADIWLVGHSLGGAVSALLGQTYGLPTVTFEAPGDAMPAKRLGLPTPPGYRIGSDGTPGFTGVYHFGHTADPVYTGTCSSCSLAGYAMESVCHTGMECRYDTVKDLGFHNYIGNHKIVTVIHDVLMAYDKPAKCEVVRDCVDCYNWKFYESNSSSSTTTKSKSSTKTSFTRTRTRTCETPGWWGCLDESTTGSHSKTSTSRSSSSSTSTCKTPGWFGCLDERTSTKTSTRTSTSSHETTSAPKTSSRASTTCDNFGWFGGCNDRTSRMSSTTSSSATPGRTVAPPPSQTGSLTPSPTHKHRKHHGSRCFFPFFFFCNEDGGDWDL